MGFAKVTTKLVRLGTSTERCVDVVLVDSFTCSAVKGFRRLENFSLSHPL